MKKLIMFAAAAAMVFTSCMQEDANQTPAGQASITVSVQGAGAPSVRASHIETPSGTNLTPSVNNCYVFVFEGDNVVHWEALTAADLASTTGKVLNGGALFDETVTVYVLANLPSGVVPAELTTWDILKGKVSEISYAGTGANISYLQPAMSNFDGARKALEINTTEANKASVTVKISPLYARIEVEGIEAISPNTATNSQVSSFAVDGVFLSNYWTGFNMIGGGAGTKKQYTAPTAGGPAAFDWTTLSGETTATPWIASGNPLKAVPAAGKVWAFHVGAGLTSNIIVRLSSAAGASPALATGAHYLTVTGYSDLTTTNFERGKIYRMSIKFVNENCEPAPILTGVGITATVTVQDWIPEVITPILPQ
jgi:hypothetical protein